MIAALPVWAGAEPLIAVCRTCKKKHRIECAPSQLLSEMGQWNAKHAGHAIEFRRAPLPGRKRSRRWEDFADNANIKTAYADSVDYTITLASLATDSSLLTGRESSAVTNASNLYIDALITGKVTTGTSPTASKEIDIFAVACESYIAGTPTVTWPDVFDGTDSAETITSTAIRDQICMPVAIMTTSSSSNIAYPFAAVSLVALFGAMPIQHVLFVTHNTAVNLNSTSGNHKLSYTPYYYTSS